MNAVVFKGLPFTIPIGARAITIIIPDVEVTSEEVLAIAARLHQVARGFEGAVHQRKQGELAKRCACWRCVERLKAAN